MGGPPTSHLSERRDAAAPARLSQAPCGRPRRTSGAYGDGHRRTGHFAGRNISMTIDDAPTVPDLSGHFGPFGGRFAPEALIAALDDLTAEFTAAQRDPEFQAELGHLLTTYAG